jgi:hypothetical protein
MKKYFRIALETQDLGGKSKERYLNEYPMLKVDTYANDPLSSIIHACCNNPSKEEILEQFDYNLEMLKRAKNAINNQDD